MIEAIYKEMNFESFFDSLLCEDKSKWKIFILNWRGWRSINPELCRATMLEF